MKYNKIIWNLVDKNIKYYDKKWAVLVHDKHNGTMFVYDILANKKHTMEYMLEQVFADGNIGNYMTSEEIEEIYSVLNAELRQKVGHAI